MPRVVLEDPGEVTLEWGPPMDSGGLSIVGYIVRMRQQLDNGTWSSAIVAYDGRSSLQQTALVTGLSASTEYAFSVVPLNYRSLCFDEDWSGESEDLRITTSSAAVPSQPKTVRTTRISGGSISVAWDPPRSGGGETILGYKVNFGQTDIELDQLTEITVADRFVTIDHLPASTTFQVLVAAFNTVGVGANSSQLLVSTTAPTPPEPPKNVKQLPSASGGAVILSWEQPSDIGGALVQFYTVFRNGSWLDITADSTAQVIYVDTTTVVANSAYAYTVTASNMAGQGAATSELIARSGSATAPSAPTVAIAHIGGGSVTVLWSPPQDTGGTPIRHFEVVIFRGTIVVTHHNGTGTTHVFEGLIAQTEYRVVATAVNDVGVGTPYSATFVTGLAEPPAKMIAPRVLNVQGGRARLEVEPPIDFGGSAVLGYRFYVASELEMEALLQTAGVYDVVGLTAKTSYLLVVTAFNMIGESISSDPVEVVTTSPSTPGIVRAIYAHSQTAYSVSVAWVPPADSGGDPDQLTYNIRLNLSSNSVSVATNVSSPYTFANLNPATTYRVQVQAASISGSGSWSDAIAMTTDSLTPGIVQFTATTMNVAEDSPFVTVLITRVNGSAMATLCDFHTIDGTALKSVQYVEASGTLRFDVGVASKNLTVRIINNNFTDDPDKFFFVGLSQTSSDSAAIGDPSQIKVTISDDGDAGSLQFVQSAYEVTESAQNLSVSINRVGRTNGAVTALVSAADSLDGGAVLGVDYLLPAPTITFANQQTSSSVLVQIVNDAIYQPRKFFSLMLTITNGRAVIGSVAEAVVTISDDGDISAPGTPTSVNVRILSGGSFSVSWTAPTNKGAANVTSVSYVVSITSKQLGVVQTMTALTETVVITDLIAHLEYQVSVAARSLQNTGHFSEQVTVRMGQTTPPSSPREVQVIAKSGGSATFSWIRPVDNGGSVITSYSVVIRSVVDGAPIGSYTSDITTISVFGLSPLTEYSAIVLAMNSDGLSGTSSEPLKLLTRSATLPSKPDGLAVLVATGGLLELKLSPPLDDGGSRILKYVVSIASPQNPVVFAEVYSGEDPVCTITRLSHSTEYKLKYRVANAVVRFWCIPFAAERVSAYLICIVMNRDSVK